jgi:hypothetical protein
MLISVSQAHLPIALPSRRLHFVIDFSCFCPGAICIRKGITMEPFTAALDVVTSIMRDGAASHPDNDWIGRTPEYHIDRAEEHLRLLREGDQQQDHLSHSVTRLLMALTLRELA